MAEANEPGGGWGQWSPGEITPGLGGLPFENK